MKHKFTYILLIAILFTGVFPANAAPALGNNDPTQTNLCDQAALDQAEADFRSLLSENGQVPVDDPAVESAAQLVINLSKKCFDTMQSERNSLNLQGDDPVFIDEGPVDRYAGGRVEAFSASDAKWGAPILGTPGGTVTYSFMGSGLNLSTEGDPSFGNSVAFTSLKGFSQCFLDEIQNAFAVWSAVSDINFVRVADSNTAFDAEGATGDIRIGAHAFDGVYGTLAHAYLPYNYYTGDGDIHFDKDETWSCTTNGGFDIGLVAIHEIGHAIGLYHENTSTTAIMNPSYNPSLSGLQSDDIAGARAIYGVAPESIFAPAGNDEIGTATLITGLTYQDKVNTSGTTPNSDPYTSSDPDPITCTDHLGTPNSLGGGWSTVWYKYKTPATVDESIQADTEGTTSYDTYIAVYEGDASGNLPSYTGFVGCNDDSPDGPFSRISFVGTKDTWYYFEVAQFRCFEVDTEGCETVPNPIGGDLTFNVNITNLDVKIAGNVEGAYYLSSEGSLADKYALDGGPVVITNTVGTNIVASLNQWRRPTTTGGWTGVTQSMALPIEQVSDTYVMPRYNGTDPTLYNAVLLANVDTVSRDITVKIGPNVMGTYTIAPSQSEFKVYNGVVGGPIVVSSDSGAKIIASLYELKRGISSGGWNGQSEMMGLPLTQISNSYILPIYFGAWPANLDASIYIANVDNVARNIEVKIAGVSKGTYNLQPNTSQILKYALDGGPVEIQSVAGAKIVASLNQWRRPTTTGGWTGVSQSMALPVGLLSNQYVMPRYNGTDTTLYNAVLLANVDTVSRDITVKIGSTIMGTYTIAPSQSEFKVYNGVAGGPIVVSSDPGAKIIASLYELKRGISSGGWNGQSEMMGLPLTQISDSYILPIYFGAWPANLDASIFIGVP